MPCVESGVNRLRALGVFDARDVLLELLRARGFIRHRPVAEIQGLPHVHAGEPWVGGIEVEELADRLGEGVGIFLDRLEAGHLALQHMAKQRFLVPVVLVEEGLVALGLLGDVVDA